MRDILKTLIGLMDKRKDLEQKPNDWERENKKSHRLRAIQENFEEGYVKKKSGNEGECLSILRGAKKGFNGRKTQHMPKVNTKKNQVSCLLVCLG